MLDHMIRFLLVDDIEENLVALEALLRRDGLEIHKARSASEALELMLVNEYALALLDVHMPETDGYELAELMRGAERTRRLPIIFVTASDVDESRRFRGYEAGAVDFIVKPINPLVLKSKSEVFFRLGQQARDLAQQRDEMRAIAIHRDQAMARLKAHADNSPLGMVELDSALVIRGWSQGAARIFDRKAIDMVGRPLDTTGWLQADTVAELKRWLAADLDPKSPARQSMQMQTRNGQGQEIACEVYGSVLTESDGIHRSLSLQVLDITERQQAEEMRSLLIGELNHRIKNTLANVQAIARQTLRQSASLAEFDRSFSGRLQALSRAHSILSDATWSSAPLDKLIDDQIKVGTLVADRLHCQGPKVDVSPENVLRLALTLHELGTNAQKYGALSVPGGKVSLSWVFNAGGLVLTWQESGGPPVAEPERSGFGLTLITASAHSDDGDAKAEWLPGGVRWTLRLSQGVTAAAGQSQAKAVTDVTIAPGKALVGCRILLIEDEPLVAMDLSADLEDMGATIVGIARNVPDALIAAQQEGVDIALLDGNLGGQRVDEIAAILRRRGIPFCFVSGYGREHLPQGYQTVPIVGKPFDPQKLFTTVVQILTQEPLPESA